MIILLEQNVVTIFKHCLAATFRNAMIPYNHSIITAYVTSLICTLSVSQLPGNKAKTSVSTISDDPIFPKIFCSASRQISYTFKMYSSIYFSHYGYVATSYMVLQ